MTPLLHRPTWKTYRVIPSHYPPIAIFERILDDPAELETLFEIGAATNPRLRDQTGDIQLVATEDRVTGPGASPVMAAFTHVGFGSRFNTNNFGAYYAANSLETAVREKAFHRERELAQADEESIEQTMRVYVGEVALALHDIRGDGFDDLHGPDLSSYAKTQPFAVALRAGGSNGILYRSVRDSGGECIAAFKPRAVTIPRQERHIQMFWDGKRQRITHWVELGEQHAL